MILCLVSKIHQTLLYSGIRSVSCYGASTSRLMVSLSSTLAMAPRRATGSHTIDRRYRTMASAVSCDLRLGDNFMTVLCGESATRGEGEESARVSGSLVPSAPASLELP